MSLSPTHANRRAADRKMVKTKRPLQTRMKAEEEYNRSERLIELVYVDVANGASRSDCIQKLVEGAYGNKPYSRRQSQYYYNAALDRFAVDTDVEMEKLRNVFYGRYESLLNEAIKKGDIYNARGILDSMSRIFGVERKTPNTAIQINGGDDKIVVNFGLEDGA